MSKVTVVSRPNRITIASKGVQGPPGPEGEQGIQGPKGDTGDVTPEALAARDAAQEAADEAVAASKMAGDVFGVDVAVPFASGLNVDSSRFTVSHGGEVYAPVADALPFTTTETFDPAQWRVIQGVTGADLAAPTGGDMVGYADPIAPGYLKTVSDMLNGVPVAATRFIPPAQHQAIRDKVSTFDTRSGLQNAVDAMADIGGGSIYLPRGRYVINSGIEWKSGVSMIGDGARASAIRAVGEIFSAIYQVGSGPPGGGDPSVVPLEDCTFANFEIDCSGLTQTTPSVNGKGLFILYMRRAKLLNLYVHDSIGTGIGCDFLTETLIHGCVVERAGRNWVGTVTGGGQSGIGIGTGWREVEAVTVSDCHTIDCGNYGIFVETQQGSSQTVFPEAARIVNCYDEGSRIGFGNKGSGGALWSGCHSKGATENGFALSQGAKGDRLIACVVEGAANEGILINNYRGPLSIIGCRSAGNGRQGLYINAAGTPEPMRDVHVLGGEYVNNGRHGILFAGSTPGIVNYSVRGATIRDNGQALTGGQRYGIGVNGKLDDGYIGQNWIGNSEGNSTQVEAIRSTSATITELDIVGNTVPRSGVANAIFISSTNTTGVRVKDNPGYNPKTTATTLSASGSPWTYTAGTSDESIYLTGTGIMVTIEGVALIDGATHINFTLPANTAAVITYTTITRARSMRL